MSNKISNRRSSVKENINSDNNFKDQVSQMLKTKFDYYKILNDLNLTKTEGNTITKLKYLSSQLEHDGWVNLRQFSTLIKACNLRIPKSELNNLYN